MLKANGRPASDLGRQKSIWPIFGRLSKIHLADFWLIFGRFWPTFGRFLADCLRIWQIFGRLLVDFGRSLADFGRLSKMQNRQVPFVIPSDPLRDSLSHAQGERPLGK